MTATGTIYVEDVATQLLTYTSVRVYRGSTTDPNTAAFTTVVATITLVSGTVAYSFTDSAGTVSSLYRCTFYTAVGPTESGFGDIIRPGATLASFRRDCSRAARAGSSGTCSALGTTTTLIDAQLAMSGVDAYFQEGNWLYRPNAATATDKLRRIAEAGFAVTTGTLTIPSAYAWAVAPANAEAYDLYGLLPPVEVAGAPYCWNDAIRDGIRNVWFRDQVLVGTGTSTGQTRFGLQSFAQLITSDSVYDVLYRSTDVNGIVRDRLLGKAGSYWMVQENDTDGLTLIVSDPPNYSTSVYALESVWLNVKRRYPMPYIDSDVMLGPLDLAQAATLRNLFLKVGGNNDPRFVEWEGKYREMYRVYGARAKVIV